MESYRFGPFQLRPDGTLLRDGRPQDLAPKQQGLLRILAGAGGRIVPKQEILDRLWPGEDVSEASLTTCVRGLRLALDDRGRRGGLLETVHGRGYRFHCTAEPATAASTAAWRSFRIGVLPFSCTRPADRYLAEGLAGEVAAGLHRWRAEGIEAIAQGSARRGWERHRDPLGFAIELGVAGLVIGRVERRPRELRALVELVRVENGAVDWAEDFVGPIEASGLLAAEIAETLAKRLLAGRMEFQPHPIPPISRDPRAHRAVLRGLFLNQYRLEAGLRRSITCFEHALGWDPGCVAAWAALGEAHLNLGWRGYVRPAAIAPPARAALARALAIEPHAVSAHAARAFLSALVDRDPHRRDESLAVCAGAESAHDRSAFLCAFAHIAAGRHERALAILDAALLLDPLSPNLAIARTFLLWVAGADEEALAAARALAEAEPEFPAGNALRADLAAHLGRHEEARLAAARADAFGRGDQMTRSACAWALGRAGREEEARAILEGFERRARSRYVSPTFAAIGYAGIGDFDAALRWLARADEARCMWLALAPQDPRLAEVRRDPRCATLLGQAARKAPSLHDRG